MDPVIIALLAIVFVALAGVYMSNRVTRLEQVVSAQGHELAVLGKETADALEIQLVHSKQLQAQVDGLRRRSNV